MAATWTHWSLATWGWQGNKGSSPVHVITVVSQGVLGQQCWKTLGCSALIICSISVFQLVIKGNEQSDPTKTYHWYQVRFCMLRACYDPEVCKPAGTPRLFYPGRENLEWNASVLCSGYLKPSSAHFGQVLPLHLQLKRSLIAVKAAGGQ